MPKTQIIHIHGGSTFDSREQFLSNITQWYDPLRQKKRWRDTLNELPGDQYEVFLPTMPASDNADYDAWRIAFEKMVPLFNDLPIILIGHSLGTIFLVKYLSENVFPKHIHSLHLVGSVFDGEGLIDEGMANFVLNLEKIPEIEKWTTNIHLYHSIDDPICPWENVEKYKKYLPSSEIHRFENRGHFVDTTFPELLEQLKKLTN